MKKINVLLIISVMLCSLLIFPNFTENASAIGQHEASSGSTYGAFHMRSIDTDSQSIVCYGVSFNDSYIYTASGNNGLDAYTFDGTSFSLVGNQAGNKYYGVYANDLYIFTVRETYGLYVYSFDGTTFTLKDNVSDGGNYREVIVDENGYIYVACDDNGLRAYTFDGTTLTLEDTVTPLDNVYAVWTNGTYIYCGGYDLYGHRINAYTFDGYSFTYIDRTGYLGIVKSICGNDTHIFSICKNGMLYAHTFNGTEFTSVTSINVGTDYHTPSIYYRNGLIYVGSYFIGMKVYALNGSTLLLYDETGISGMEYKDIAVSEDFVYTASGTTGVSAYSICERLNTTRTVFTITETNNCSITTSINHTGIAEIKIPVSSEVKGIISVTNNTCGNQAVEVNSSSELINNTFWYDGANQFVHIRTINLTTSAIVNWTVNCSLNVTFNLIIPPYLTVGQYFHSSGFIEDSDGNAISGMIAETRLLYANGTDALPVNPKHNCTNGNYRCTFSTAVLPPGVYSVSIEFTDPGSGIIFKEGSILYLSFNTPTGVYSDALVHFSFYNTNIGLGLIPETFKVYVDDVRNYANEYYGYTGETINITIKDYYDFTMYSDNYTIVSTHTGLNFGLTFHEYDFTNENNEYFYASFKKENATLWYERVISSSGGQKSFMLPTGNYTARVYNADNSTYISWTELVNRSKAYLIGSDGLTLIIQGQSVIIDDLLELRIEFDDATRPDIVSIIHNPPSCYSVWNTNGAIIGTTLVCPYLIVTATTRNESYIDTSIVSHPLKPTNNSANGTIYIKKDVLYLMGNASTLWVNLSYGGTSTNYTYIPSKINLFGEDVTIVASENISFLRETTYQQQKKFYWTKSLNINFYEATVSIINPLTVPIYEVYVHVEFANDDHEEFGTVVNASTIRVYDVTNGVYLIAGKNFDAGLKSIQFYLDSVASDTTRRYECEYYARTDSQLPKDAITVVDVYDMATHNNKNYYHFKAQWVNLDPDLFLGSLRIRMNFSTYPFTIAPQSIDVYDDENDRYLFENEFTFTGSSIVISQEMVGNVIPNGARNFHVYFLFDDEEAEAKEIAKESVNWLNAGFSLPIFGFELKVVHLILLGWFGAIAVAEKQGGKKHKYRAWTGFFALMLFLTFIYWIGFS